MSAGLPSESLEMQLRALCLPSFVAHHAEVAEKAERQGWTFKQYLHHLCELEVSDRSVRRIERLRKESGLAPDKTLETLDVSVLPPSVRRALPRLCEGQFVERAENVLAFGMPGRGKTHVVSAIGHELIKKGIPVLFVKAYRLVQRLLVAKRDLRLEGEVRRLDRFAAVVIDDIGYVQQDADEMEVLFTFLAERYERRSVMITSNLVFSQWDQIFRNTMTTAAAIDRLVHHCTILELTGASYRTESAKKSQAAGKKETEVEEGEQTETGSKPDDPKVDRGRQRRSTGF